MHTINNQMNTDFWYSNYRKKYLSDWLGGITLFSERLKMLRVEKHLRQEDVAKALDVTKATISAYENGWRHPSEDMLVKLSNYFRVSVDFLLGENNNRCAITYRFSEEQLKAAKEVLEAILRCIE